MKKLLISIVLLPFLIGCGHPVAVGLAVLFSQPSGKKDKPAGPPPELLEITTTTLPYAINGVDYDQAVEATGGVPPYDWSVSASNPPDLVAIDPATGVLSGTPGDTAGDYAFTVEVLDSALVGATRNLTITLYDELQITFTPPLPDAVNGVSYGPVTITASGGTGNITWSIPSGSRPTGLSIDQNNGQISGTPGDIVGVYSFTVAVRDDATPRQTATLDLTMNLYDPLNITTASLPDGAVDTGYLAQVEVSGNSGDLTWSLSGATSSLSINTSTGVISGTPVSGEETGSPYTFTVDVTDNVTGSSDSENFTVNIYEALQITTGTLADGAVGAAYSAPVAATGGSGSVTWSLSGAPSSISIAPDTGLISGTPAGGEEGSYTFTVAVTDNATGDTESLPFAVQIYQRLQIITVSLPDGAVNAAYSIQVEATGGSGDVTWSLSGAPSSILINTATGLISGTPVSGEDGAYTLGATVTDNVTGGSDSLPFAVDIYEELQITTASLPDGMVDVLYSTQVQATGGSGNITWSLSGAPSSISIAPGTGLISGTPVSGDQGPYTFAVTVTDNVTGGSDSSNYSVQIELVLLITTGSLPDSYVGATYNEAVDAISGVTPYTWSWSGSTPSGLGIASGTGVISGTPLAAGDYTFTVEVLDSDTPAATDNREFTIQIYEKLLVTTAALPDGEEDMLYSETLSATGGAGSPTWSIVSGSLPPGLDISASTGEIYGTPEVGAGGNTYDFRARVVDGADSDEKDLSITVNAPSSAPKANFTATPTCGTTPLLVSFTDKSTGTYDSWEWDFENDGSPDSLVQDPWYQYDVPDWYTVKLTVSGSKGSDSCTRKQYILAANNIRYADSTISSSGDGTTWATAFKTIQEALDAAIDYDLVFAADGTYTGAGNRNLDFAGKAVYLKSASGATSCIIDAENTDYGFYFQNGETGDAVVDGFTITRGQGGQLGGNFRITGASPTIRNCIVESGYAENWGSGAGFYISGGSEPAIESCIIRNNENHGHQNGAGLHITSGCSATIVNCIIANNYGGTGGGVFIGAQTDVGIYNCTIINNDGTGRTGIRLNGDWSATYTHAYVYNSIIWDDGADTFAHAELHLYNCDINSTGGSVTLTDCINADPLFVDVGTSGLGGYGDYHLQGASACVDTGDSSSMPEWVNTDLDNNPRIVNGTVDMGAYEKQ